MKISKIGLIAALIIVFVLGLFIGSSVPLQVSYNGVFAKGNHASGGGSSLTLVMVTDKNANSAPNWGDTITWNVQTTATTQPNVSVTCYQNGVVVYGAVSGYYSSYPAPWTQNMALGSQTWTGGAADCVAQLYYFKGTKTINLTSLSFTTGA